MSNHLTDAQYAAFIDRLVECREAEDAAKDDTKTVYAELADAGEDKTAAGLIVRGLRMSAKDRTKANIRDAAVENGLERYNRGKASHVRVREESPEHDAETGEIIEPQAQPATSGATAANAVTAGRAPTDELPDQGGDDVEPPPAHAPEQPGNDHGSVRALDASGAHASEIHEPDATLRPQTGGETLVANSEAAEFSTSDPLRSDAATREGAGAAASEASSPGIKSVPLAADGVSATSSAGTEGEADRQPITATVIDMTQPNPICRDPGDCGTYASWHLPCEICKAAAAHRSAA